MAAKLGGDSPSLESCPMPADILDPPGPGRIVDEPVEEALSTRYLAYALSTITQRALPDVRDGLKPVQRRILYAMRELKLDPKSGFKKCARIVGDVIGKYHPHGDTAAYDALVRLAQTFAQRYPLVDGQGNFGNVDGDNAAAYRYTEARLTEAAEALLQGLDQDAVDFRPTFDGTEQEPVVLPAAFPNLLANGSTGIAVGMATSIPPHNAAELIDAARLLVKRPKADVDALLELVKGPDLPTGGIIVEPKESIREAYETGRGGFRVRARWEVEDLGRGAWQVVVTEIPYQVVKGKLIERIADLIENRKVPLVEEAHDESAEDVRIVISPKARTVDADMMMESLFHQCDLEIRVPLNMNVIDAQGAPRVMSLRDVLRAFLDHRRACLLRRTQNRLEKIADRLEVLGGYLIAYLNIDEVIRIIREEDEPKPVLMKRFKLSERQTEAILNMRLRSLRRLEEFEIKTENKTLKEEQKTLKALLADEKAQWKEIDGELVEARKLFDPKTSLGRRRTDLGDAPSTERVTIEALVHREPITVVLSKKGWIRALKGRVEDLSDLKYKEGDGPGFSVFAETTDKILMFGSDGRVYTLAGDKLPGGRGHGEPIRLQVDFPDDHAPIALHTFVGGRQFLLASEAGNGFLAPEDELIALKRAGKQVMNLGPGEEAVAAIPVEGDHVAVVGANRKLLLFPLNELPEMARGKGVRLQAYKDGGLADVVTFNKKEGLYWIDASGRRFAPEDWKDWLGRRAQAGRLAPRGFPRSGLLRPRLG
jgi:topoisomerase-4 subunit A